MSPDSLRTYVFLPARDMYLFPASFPTLGARRQPQRVYFRSRESLGAFTAANIHISPAFISHLIPETSPRAEGAANPFVFPLNHDSSHRDAWTPVPALDPLRCITGQVFVFRTRGERLPIEAVMSRLFNLRRIGGHT